MLETDWGAIRREYETDGTSARALGRKYGISHTTINNKARDEGWIKGDKPVSTEKVSTKKVSTKKWKLKRRKNGKWKVENPARNMMNGFQKLSTEENSSEDFFLSFNPADFGLSEIQGLFAEYVASGKKLVEAYASGLCGEVQTARLTGLECVVPATASGERLRPD